MSKSDTSITILVLREEIPENQEPLIIDTMMINL